MSVLKFLYHGSNKRLKMLLPRNAQDVSGDKDNSLNAVYASSWKKEAIIMGILSCDGVNGASTHITGKIR